MHKISENNKVLLYTIIQKKPGAPSRGVSDDGTSSSEKCGQKKRLTN
jgi:hypothetical protein